MSIAVMLLSREMTKGNNNTIDKFDPKSHDTGSGEDSWPGYTKLPTCLDHCQPEHLDDRAKAWPAWLPQPPMTNTPQHL